MHDRLDEVTRLVPPAALRHLQRVRLWLDLDPSGDSRPLAFYASSPSIPFASAAAYRHKEHYRGYGGFHGAMYRGVVVPNIVRLIEVSSAWKPLAVLHELAHGYHDQVLGRLHPEIYETYAAAKAKGLYVGVSHRNGARLATGYAIQNGREYFAQLTETYFGNSDQTPFDAAELKTYDPDGFRLIERAWSGALGSIAPAKMVACRSPI